MFSQKSGLRIVLLVLVAVSMLGLPAAVAAQTANGITSPKDGATVSGAVPVTGYAADAKFMKWQLDLLPGGNADMAAFLALGVQPGPFTTTLTSATYPDGQYVLRLRVVKTDSNYIEYTSKVTIANTAKPAAAATPAPKAPITATVTAPKAPVTATVAAPKAPVTATVTAPKAAVTATVTAPKAPVTATVAAPKAPAAAAPALTTNGIASPKDGATVSGAVPVKGYAADAKFMKWQLDLLPGGNADMATFIALGVQPGAFTTTLTSATYPDGQYVLRLRVVKTDSNYIEYTSKVTIANTAKPAAAATPAPKAAVTTTVTAPKAPVTATVTAPKAPVTATVTAPKTPVTATVTAPKAPVTATVTAPKAPVTTTVTAPKAPAAAAPALTTNGIASPKDGTTVSGIVSVKGYAADAKFMKWQLDLLLNGNSDTAGFVALGVQPGPFTTTLNTAAYPAGAHALRLRVVKTDSNYTEYTTKITIAR